MSFTPSSSAVGQRAAVAFMTNSWTAKPVPALKGHLGQRGGRANTMVKNGPSQQHLVPVLLLLFPWHCQNQQIWHPLFIPSHFQTSLAPGFFSQKKQWGLGPALADSKIQLLPFVVTDSSTAEQFDLPYFSLLKMNQMSLLQQSNAHEMDERIVLLHSLGHHHLELLSHYKKCRNHKMFSVQFQWPDK